MVGGGYEGMRRGSFLYRFFVGKHSRACTAGDLVAKITQRGEGLMVTAEFSCMRTTMRIVFAF